jgi:hypothetical protein
MAYPWPRWISQALVNAIPALIVADLATCWCWWATGAGLGLFLGAILLLTLYTPPLALSQRSDRAWIAALGAAIGASIVLGVSIAPADVDAGECLRCALVLAAYAFALSGFAITLATIRFPAPVAGGITVVIGLLWLAWPVWLSPWMTQSRADWLTPANPLLAVNGVIAHLGSWDHAPIAYRSLTVLNQDVPYRLPKTIMPAVVLHAFIGAAGLLLVRLRDRGRKHRTDAQDAHLDPELPPSAIKKNS